MARLHTPQARFAMVGMPVRQQNLLFASYPDHVIVSTAHNPDGTIKITTNQGEWDFRPDEIVTFPRRPEGQTYDWRGHTPTALDLAIGDVLDPKGGAKEITKPSYTDEDRKNAPQYVTAINRSPGRPDLVSINLNSALTGPSKINVWVGEPIAFPRLPNTVKRTGSRNPFVPVQLTGYGPYLYIEPNGDEYLYFLITHPTGGGRWPLWVEQPIEIGTGVYLSRPPSNRRDWSSYRFCGERWDRHPRDPKWSQYPTLTIEPERLSAARQAYAYYRESTASIASPLVDH